MQTEPHITLSTERHAKCIENWLLVLIAAAYGCAAEPERDRAVNLRNGAAISAAQYDAAISQWSIAEARQAEATAIAEHAVLRAPFAGVVTAKLANVGDTAMPGQALLILEAPGAFRF